MANGIIPRQPLSYRGLTLACTIKVRSTIDHVSSLKNTDETSRKLKLSTFCAFMDFQKAFDFLDMNVG
ncbi:hypothetical protein MAR_006863 [Mya arenaria]|uniref:Reverse transcriptase domain-containing protein n=1 Tax=Mya arenaria TaxID=6604 RepID=A0ABY7D9R6_MYAAR|nr:hypothetical protein MAR_006863 [Mya arenaria]